jgi:hypothetical protein
MTCRCRKGNSIRILSSDASNRDMGLISKPSSALSVLGEANTLHNKNDRGFVVKETEELKRGVRRKRLYQFCTALLFPAPGVGSRQNQALNCSVRRKVRMCPRVCVV